MSHYPRRLVCLTEETTETLYLLGEEERIVGISGFTVRPKEARKKPKVSTYLEANYDKILQLEPDLVLAFSDLQANITAELVRRGLTVVTFNQRSISELLQAMRMLGGLIGCSSKADALAERLESDLDVIRQSAARLPRRPRVFFEEWPDPLISGIQWVEELVEVAGGEPCFPELRTQKAAQGRVVEPPQVRERNPDCILASWCGRKVKKDVICSRPGWDEVLAVKKGHVYEVDSSVILQPGPAALTEGVRQLAAFIALAVGAEIDPRIAPRERLDDRVRT